MSRRPPRRVPRMARTLWSLSVLALLRERPMHPYELQRQMHLRHTDERLGLKRGDRVTIYLPSTSCSATA